ncbi:MAG: hypothetical protein GEU80_05335 [Dehalococcoidia bacterium]|nr:hypothetical protein [Dehalococcoidia bacterium]
MPRREPGAPPQVNPQRLGDYLEAMSKSVFQTGISWDVVDKKWPGIRGAFAGFDAKRVAAFGEPEVTALASDTRVIRNRRKIEAIVGNAQRMLDLEAEHGGFREYLRSHGDFEATVKDLRKQFKFLGETGCYIFLYVVQEPVPEYHEWRASRDAMQRPRAPRAARG